jgi:hypothetical protein
LLLSPACSSVGLGGESGSDGISGTIDEHQNVFNGLAIGDTQERMHELFGERVPADRDEPVFPANSSLPFRGPLGFKFGTGAFYRYDGVTVFTVDGKVTGFMVTSNGSTTLRGVGIGDSLEQVQSTYHQLDCGTAHPEGSSYPACFGKLSPTAWIWFGGDPVSNITFGRGQMSGVAD